MAIKIRKKNIVKKVNIIEGGKGFKHPRSKKGVKPVASQSEEGQKQYYVGTKVYRKGGLRKPRDYSRGAKVMEHSDVNLEAYPSPAMPSGYAWKEESSSPESAKRRQEEWLRERKKQRARLKKYGKLVKTPTQW